MVTVCSLRLRQYPSILHVVSKGSIGESDQIEPILLINLDTTPLLPINHAGARMLLLNMKAFRDG